MEYTKFSKYYQYSLNNKVKPIPCGIDEDHPGLVPNLDIDNNGEDVIYLYCLACNFKIFPGLELYNNIEFIIEELEIDD